MKKYGVGFAVMLLCMVSMVIGVQVGMRTGKAVANAAALENMEIQRKALMLEYGHLQDIYSILQCESDMNHGAVGDGGRARGIAQFHRGTFDFLKSKARMEHFEYTSREDQIRLLDWSVENGYANWWTCYTKLKISGRLHYVEPGMPQRDIAQ